MYYKSKRNLMIAVGIIAVFLIILLIVQISKGNVQKLTSRNYNNWLNKSEYSVVYIGNINDEIKSRLKKIREDYALAVFYYPDSVSSIPASDGILLNDNAYILYNAATPIAILNKADYAKQKEIIEKYVFNRIPTSEIAYKVPSNAEQFIKLVKSNKYTIAVIGKNNCSFCDLYVPVFNDLAREKNLDIYYINRNEYDQTEYDKIMALDLTIPGKCTLSGEDTSMSKSFEKPMTMIFRKGKLVDCILGYVTTDVLNDKLEEIGIIKGD